MPPHSRLLLLLLADLANTAGTVTTTQGSLAELMNVKPITVRRALKICERRGVIEIRPDSSRRQGAREGLTYQLLIPLAPDASDPHAVDPGNPSTRVS